MRWRLCCCCLSLTVSLCPKWNVFFNKNIFLYFFMCSKIVIDMDIYIQQTHIYYSGYNELHLERVLVTLIAYMTQTVSSRYTDVFVSFIFKIFLYFFHWCINVFKKSYFSDASIHKRADIVPSTVSQPLTLLISQKEKHKKSNKSLKMTKVQFILFVTRSSWLLFSMTLSMPRCRADTLMMTKMNTNTPKWKTSFRLEK